MDKRLITGKQYVIGNSDYDDTLVGEPCIYLGKANKRDIVVKVKNQIIYLERNDIFESYQVF
jgi:hypothetical protein